MRGIYQHSNWNKGALVVRNYGVYDAVDNNISIPHTVNNDPSTSDFTFSTWVYFGNNTTGITETILEKGVGGVCILLSTTRRLRVGLNNTGAYYVETAILPIDTWYHILLTYKVSTQTIKGYLDGVFFDDRVSALHASSTNTSPIVIGSRTGGTKAAFGGKIGVTKEWKRELLSNEVLLDYEGVRITDSLVQEHLMISNGNDTSSFSNHGGIIGGTTFSVEYL